LVRCLRLGWLHRSAAHSCSRLWARSSTASAIQVCRLQQQGAAGA
jgi:hypothetical protein